MKKLLFICFTAIFLLGMTMSANAALKIINFDEAGISFHDIITNQYNDMGINFNFPNQITSGSSLDFENPFSSDGQILQYNSKSSEIGIINLGFLADSFVFEHRRPKSSGTFNLKLNNGTDTVYQTTVSSSGSAWTEFEYDGANGLFDQIVMYSTNKFIIDNLEINSVPVPTSLLLLVSGLFPIVWRKAKR